MTSSRATGSGDDLVGQVEREGVEPGVDVDRPIETGDDGHAIFGNFPPMFGVVAVLTFLLLARAFRSVVLAVKAIVLNLVSLASAPDTDLKVFATGLGVGILLDATLIRALLLPALVAWFGGWNWWFPRPVARLLRVLPAPEPARS